MENVLTFTAQGKYRHYPGKATVIDDIEDGKEVELTFFPEDKKIIVINPYGEISGCIPCGHPIRTEGYDFLCHHLNIGSPIKAIAIPHGVFTYDIQVTITT